MKIGLFLNKFTFNSARNDFSSSWAVGWDRPLAQSAGSLLAQLLNSSRWHASIIDQEENRKLVIRVVAHHSTRRQIENGSFSARSSVYKIAFELFEIIQNFLSLIRLSLFSYTWLLPLLMNCTILKFPFFSSFSQYEQQQQNYFNVFHSQSG
jgi:hypothetical protein